MSQTARDGRAASEAAETSASAEAPLAGVRVVEMGTMLAGPLCARLLGDYGAEIIKIEDPSRGDIGRSWGRHKYRGRSLWWPIQGRNKRCVTINLRDPEGQDLARRLCATADVLVENFRPGTLERWELGPDRLHEDNPGLVVVRVSGFGQTGPDRDKAGFGVVGEAVGGLRYTTGYPNQAPPRVGVSIGDELASVFGVVGALLALRARERTGRGQVVDVAIYEAVFAMMESVATEYAKLGVLPERTGSRLPGVAPSNLYPTAEGEWVIIAGNAENVFRRLMTAIGRPALGDDPRFADHVARATHHEELDRIIAEWSSQRSADDITAAMHDAGVPSCKVYSPADMLRDPQYWAREMLLRRDDDELGELVVPGVVPKLSDTPGDVRWLGRPHGADNEAILGEELGIGDERLAAMRERGVV
jgi:crotonobetainyl-CoA:carnitine CoA-transferase CaiB-like acyl-CoA transferase